MLWVKSSVIYYINMIFDSPAEIREEDYAGEWKSHAVASKTKSSELKDEFLKQNPRKKRKWQAEAVPLPWPGHQSPVV